MKTLSLYKDFADKEGKGTTEGAYEGEASSGSCEADLRALKLGFEIGKEVDSVKEKLRLMKLVTEKKT